MQKGMKASKHPPPIQKYNFDIFFGFLIIKVRKYKIFKNCKN